MDHDFTVYEPNQRARIGFFQTWVIMFRNIVKSRELIWQLFRRDFFMSYKKSFLGITWIFIAPVIGIVSWIFLNSAGILQPGETSIPFPAYVLLGSSIWGLFMGFYSAASGTLSAGMSFITQVKYPHEVLLIKQTGQHLANFLITFLVNIVVLLLFGVVPSAGILLVPIVVIPLFFLGAGLGLFVSVLSVVASDITNIINILLGFFFYAIPIVYQLDKIDNPLLRIVVQLNPISYLITGVRDLIIEGKIYYLDRYILVSVISFIFFLLSWRLFFVSEDKVIERMI